MRKGIGKALRFSVFARDNFTCRYCGRQSDAVTLVIDHVMPVCQGGTNDVENLVTACVDCNSGKGGRTIQQTVPTEADRLRLSQERNEQITAYEAARMSAEAREQMREVICGYWCDVTGRDSMDRHTLNVMARYVEEFGAEKVFRWIDKAYARIRGGSDVLLGKYVSGIRRREIEAMKKGVDHA